MICSRYGQRAWLTLCNNTVCILYCAIYKFASLSFFASNIGYIILSIVASIITLDIGLGVFNMIPLPPLDGSKIFLPILPRNAKIWFIQHEQTFYFIFLIIWITGIAGSLISPIIDQITNNLHINNC